MHAAVGPTAHETNAFAEPSPPFVPPDDPPLSESGAPGPAWTATARRPFALPGGALERAEECACEHTSHGPGSDLASDARWSA